MATNAFKIEWKGFVAAFLHDLGKTILNESGFHEFHEDLNKTEFRQKLQKDLIDLIRQHDNKVYRGKATHSPEETALLMADCFQKGMHGADDLEANSELRALQKNPAFYPYYGRVQEGYTQTESKTLSGNILNLLKPNLDLKSLLGLQTLLQSYPHTSYLPHLSLALHHQFTALLFFFLSKQMAREPPPEELKVSVITVTPEALSLFYRLRDVGSHKRAVDFLREQLFRRVFLKHSTQLPGLNPRCNPFEFFDGGNTLVLVYDEAETIVNELQSVIDKEEYLRSLTLEVMEFHLLGKWEEGKGFKARLSSAQPHTRVWTIMPKNALDFPEISMQRCGICGKPQKNMQLDNFSGDTLCDACLDQRTHKREKSQVVDIHEVGGDEGKVAYVIIALREPLYEQSIEVGRQLLSKFAGHRMVDSGLLRPSAGGLFEYLQSVRDIQSMQQDIDQVIERLRGKTHAAYSLIKFPTIAVYLMQENKYWDFLGFLDTVRDKLRLPHCVRGIVCSAKTPFWSLMDGFTSYSEQDYYYDASGRSIVMFTKEEVAEIRSIATIAKSEWRSSAQLMALSRFALNRNLDELLLEIDVRAGQGKLTNRLVDVLKKSLSKISGEDAKEQAKRAKFIDYVTKLARAQGESRKGR